MMQQSCPVADFVYVSNATRSPEASPVVLRFAGRSSDFDGIDGSRSG